MHRPTPSCFTLCYLFFIDNLSEKLQKKHHKNSFNHFMMLFLISRVISRLTIAINKLQIKNILTIYNLLIGTYQPLISLYFSLKLLVPIL